MADTELDMLEEYFCPSKVSDYYTYSYDHDMDARLGDYGAGPACLPMFLKTACAEMTAQPGALRRWMCRTRLGGDTWRWVVASGSPGLEVISGDLHRIGAALRCLFDIEGPMDEVSATLQLLPRIQSLWWAGAKEVYQHRTPALAMEEFTRGVAVAWLKCGGEAALHELRGVLYGTTNQEK